MIRNPAVLLIGFFLFFQSGFETLTTTWTPKYFMEVYLIDVQSALISLTVMSISLTVARILLGFALKKIEPWKVLGFGLVLTLSGLILMRYGGSYLMGLAGIALLGFGAAASFPVMLGYVVTMLPDISGAAFSLVLMMALTGNMLLNSLGGVVFEKWEVASFTLYQIAIMLAMMFILYLIVRKLKKEKINT